MLFSGLPTFFGIKRKNPPDNLMGYTDNVQTDAAQNWADVPKCPGYRASDMGVIVNRRGKPLKQWRESSGAVRTWIKGRNRMVNYLVLTAFTGCPPCAGYFVRNRNGDRSDNSLENLVWAGSGVSTHGRF